MRYQIKHITEYKYQELVNTAHNRLCLVPLNLTEQKCLSSSIKVLPVPDEQEYRTDFFGNTLYFVSIYKEHNKLEVTSESLVDVLPRIQAGIAASSTLLWENVKSTIAQRDDYAEIAQYLLPSHYVPYSLEIQKFAEDCFIPGDTLWNASNKLMKKIFTSLEFKPGFTTVNTPVETVVKLKKGVCQDFAHLMIACLRNQGIAARYVSGYLETFPPPGKKKLVGSDASHAWVAVYFPGIGWVEFDPTNNLLPADNHIIVAFGRDYFDVAPLKGIIFSSGTQKVDVKVDVTRV
jgi:transglutaminase-like putative cysteine protease